MKIQELQSWMDDELRTFFLILKIGLLSLSMKKKIKNKYEINMDVKMTPRLVAIE